MNKLPRISLCMIAKNEEEFISQAIRSVLPIISEIVVVDTGSTDRTVEIAASFGARIFHQKWSGNFSLPRNLSLKKARGEWILVLDADEAIAAQDLDLLTSLTARRDACYMLTQRHYTNDYCISGFTPVSGEYPDWERHYAGYHESSLVRLFPNHPRIRYQNRVHELVEPAIIALGKHRILSSGIRIHHYGSTPEVLARKNKRQLYGELGEEKIREKPSNWKAYYELGIEHNTSGRYEAASECLRRAVELAPSHVPAHINLANALFCLKRYGEAAACLARALELDPNYAEAYCNLGVVFQKLGRYELAEKSLCTAIQLNPKYVNAIHDLGRVFACQQKTREAELAFRRTLELVPRSPEGLQDLGTLLLNTRRFDEAADCFAKAASETTPHAYLGLGLACRELKRCQEALAALEKFCEIETKLPPEKFSDARRRRLELVRADIAALREQNQTPN